MSSSSSDSEVTIEDGKEEEYRATAASNEMYKALKRQYKVNKKISKEIEKCESIDVKGMIIEGDVDDIIDVVETHPSLMTIFVTHSLIRSIMSDDDDIYNALTNLGGEPDYDKVLRYGMTWASFEIMEWYRDNVSLDKSTSILIKEYLSTQKDPTNIAGDNEEWIKLI